METSLEIFTDGGCSGNPGPGGWAYVIVGEKIIAREMGAEENTTNNRMELTAVIAALRKFKTLDNALQDGVPRKATVLTDSQYVQKGITEWISKWKRNSWRTADKKPVKNRDLWIELDSLAGELPLVWQWVRGHSGVRYNEECDRMVQEAIRSIGN